MLSPQKTSDAAGTGSLAANRLEDRILMSATPFDDMVLPQGDASTVTDYVLDADGNRIYAPLSASSDTQAPTFMGNRHITDGEDANDLLIEFNDFFEDDLDPALTYVILDNSNPDLFANVTQGGINGENLLLDYADDAFGEAIFTIRAIDDAGNFVDDELHVTVLPLNDRPTTTGFTDIVVPEDGPSTAIDLFAAFDDVEDADELLTYTITKNTNPGLFQSIVIDATTGKLILEYAPDAVGTAEITIRATDTEGMFVEMSSDHGFELYRSIWGTEGVHFPDLPYVESDRWSAGNFFHEVNGEYDYESVNEAELRQRLQEHPAGIPIVIDLEHELFDNTPEGRDRFAEIFHIFRDERPDIEFGLYRIMPERSYLIPFNYARSLEDDARGLFTYYRNNSESIANAYNAWLGRNAMFRDIPVSAEYGGIPLADFVDTMHPSLYTFKRNDTVRPTITRLSLDAGTDTFTLPDSLIADGIRVRIMPAFGATTPDGLEKYVYYYVVNTDANGAFQLSETVDGAPLQFNVGGEGDLYLELNETRFHGFDANVVHWEDYAALNIEEARKFNKDKVIPFLSPSISGVGAEYLDKNFFREQLDLMFELAEGVTIYNARSATLAQYQFNPGWWDALTEFHDYINSPTQFTVTVNNVNDAPTSTGVSNVLVDPGQAVSLVDLYSFFNDDGGQQNLTWTITEVTSPHKIADLSINNGILDISHAANEVGISFVTLQATDIGGLSVTDTFLVQVGEAFMAAPNPIHEVSANSPISAGLVPDATSLATEPVETASEFNVAPTQQAIHWHTHHDAARESYWDNDTDEGGASQNASFDSLAELMTDRWGPSEWESLAKINIGGTSAFMQNSLRREREDRDG